MVSLLWCAAAAATVLVGSRADTVFGDGPGPAPASVDNAAAPDEAPSPAFDSYYDDGTPFGAPQPAFDGYDAASPYEAMAPAFDQYDQYDESSAPTAVALSGSLGDDGYDDTATPSEAPGFDTYDAAGMPSEAPFPYSDEDSTAPTPAMTDDGDDAALVPAGAAAEDGSPSNTDAPPLPGTGNNGSEGPSSPQTDAENATATLTFQWKSTHGHEAPCTAKTDLWGYCGNKTATVTTPIVCQALAVSVNGSVEVLMPFITTQELDSFLTKRAETLAEDNTVTARRLHQTATEVPEAWYKMPVDNGCTAELEPSAASRTSKCAERDCDVLVVQPRPVGPCFSEQNLDCGPMKQVTQTQCFSPQRGIFITDAADMADSACAKASIGMEIDNCTATPKQECPPGAFWRYQPWGACSADCDASECDGKALCMPIGRRSRDAECVKYVSGNVVAADGECDLDAMEASVDVECERRCFNADIRHRRVESECTARGDQACGAGDITVSFELCGAGETGCSTYINTTATTRSCSLGSCTPCEDFCVDSNTEEATPDTTAFTCACTCKAGFGGMRCERDLSPNAPPPKVYDAEGRECASAVLDLDRICCERGLDGCGMCAEREYPDFGKFRIGLDAQGQCCHHKEDTVMLTGDFTCCAGAAELDECGVCRGDGSTCRKSAVANIDRAADKSFADFADAIKATLPADVVMFAQDAAGADQLGEATPSTASRRLLAAADETYGVEPTTVEVSAGQMALKYFAVGTSTEFADPVLTSLPAPAVQGRANNGVCETGEPDDSSDCPVPAACPLPSQALGSAVVIGSREAECGGNGICSPVGGVCQCSAGYVGAACDACDIKNKFVDVTLEVDGIELTACTLLATDRAAISGDPTPPAPTGQPATPVATSQRDGSTGLGGGAIAGIVVGVIGGVAVLGGIAYYSVRVRGARIIGPAGGTGAV